jgi:hypothetical protein
MNVAYRILAAGLLCLPCGCGTLNNAVLMSYHQRPHDLSSDYQPPDYVYGGVRFDAMAIRYSFKEDREDSLGRILAPLWFVLWCADIPLSAVCDTVLLPYTIAVTSREADWWREFQKTQRQNSSGPANETKDADDL